MSIKKKILLHDRYLSYEEMTNEFFINNISIKKINIATIENHKIIQMKYYLMKTQIIRSKMTKLLTSPHLYMQLILINYNL